MSKIHIYESRFPEIAAPKRAGSIRCVYHVDISGVKDTDLSTALFGIKSGSSLIKGIAKVQIGGSGISGDLSTHPSFPGGGTAIAFSIAAAFNTSLNNGNIAAQLRIAFSDAGQILTQAAAVSSIDADVAWMIIDGARTHTLTAVIVAASIDSIAVSAEIDRLESVLLQSGDLAEVTVLVARTEGESAATLSTRVDNLYDNVESKVQAEYGKRYKYYGETRNPA